MFLDSIPVVHNEKEAIFKMLVLCVLHNYFNLFPDFQSILKLLATF